MDVATVEGRKAFAKERGLCLECFRSMRNHDKTGRCSTRGGACVHCKGRHNSVLCENKFSVSERSIEKPPSSTRTPVEAPDEQLLAQQEQLYQLATLLEQEKVSLSDERDALDKLKAQLESRKEAKQSLKAERAQIQLKRSHMEAERIHFDHQLQSLKDEQQAKRLLQLDRTLRLQKELDSLEAENERLKLSVGHSSASDSPSRSRSVPSVDGVKPCAAKRSRISFP
ncbi:hypothetical protein AAVH_09529 [Aphelenchoides avenae]|nr:hypothetical protein AAVH_09529 [Aphelenchus avenae]